MVAPTPNGEGARPLSYGLRLAALVFLVDQLSKWLMVEVVMAPARTIEVTPFFRLVMAWNRGVSFGLLDSESPYGPWLLSAASLAVVAGLVVWLRRTAGGPQTAAVGLIIGGALGNVLDRLRFGAVADFLDFHWGEYHWPAFNAADTAITLGVAVLIFDALFRSGESPKN